jgi:hypothetical protein
MTKLRDIGCAALALLLLGSATPSESTTLARGYLRNFDGPFAMDSVSFLYLSSAPLEFVTHHWGGFPQALDSFDFQLAAWPDVGVALHGNIDGRRIPEDTIRPLAPDQWYVVRGTRPSDSCLVQFHELSAIEERRVTGLPLRLLAPAPNPFSAATGLGLSNPTRQRLDLVILDAAGARVRLLASGRFAAGEYRPIWDGTDDQGRRVRNGVYYCRLRAGEFVALQKLVLAR